MKPKTIPYGRQHITQEDINAVVQTLQSDFLTQGPKIKEFEDAFAQYVGSKYAVAVNNATAGLHLAVLALGLKKGERVITTPITFAASANCVRYADGEVWFVDIDPDTYLLDINSVKKLIKSKPKGFFKGIIPVDFAGLPVDLESFRNLANEHGLWIIEDACHAPGGYFTDSKGVQQMCGNCQYADVGVFSFHPVKHIACGEGGMLTTNSKRVYDKLILLRTHGITKDNMIENHGGWYYEMHELGFNYRLTDFQAALGITQLAKNNQGVKRRNEIAIKYKEAFQNTSVKFQDLPEHTLNAHHLFVIEVDDRKGLYDYLHANDIFAQIHYIPCHLLPYYRQFGWREGDMPNAENYYKHCISLPMYPTLTEEEQDFVIKKVCNFFKMSKTAPVLTSDRLVLKPLGLEHFSEDYVQWMNTEEVIKYLESGGNYTLEMLESFLKEQVSKNILFWAIHIKESDKHIGNIKIDPIDEQNNSGEYGIMMGDMTEWGKGYAKEASCLVIDFCFSKKKLSAITLGVIEANLAAVRLYERIGFKVNQVKENVGNYDGRACNAIRMILKNEH